MENVRVRLIIEGRVQGVFFRHHTQEMAAKLGLKGWVKNMQNGDVEAIFEGPQQEVNQMIQWCRQGPPRARVTRVHQVWEHYKGEFKDFSVGY